MATTGSHETRSRQLLELLVGREHASRISRRHGPIDDTQVATFTWKHALDNLIQNGLPTDSEAKDFSITVDPKAGTAVLRDDGEGYTLYRQFICSTSKLDSPTAVGLLGRGGTKEGPLALALQDVVVGHRSRDWATVALAVPYPEEGVKLLEFDYVTGLPAQKGTSIHLAGLTAEMIAYLQRPEENFLYFRRKKGWKPKYVAPSEDSIISFNKGEVFIRGVKISDHPTALFGYNFQTIRIPLGRERDKFDSYEVLQRARAIYATCTDQDVLTSILRAGNNPQLFPGPKNFYLVDDVPLEFFSIPRDPTDAVKNAWLDSFHSVYGTEAILVDSFSTKKKERLAHVARAQGKTPVLLNDTLARNLHAYGITYDSDLTANYEDIMWTSGELEKLPPGRLQQIDIPLHTKGEKRQKDAVFHTVYAASAAQCIQDPKRTTYEISFVVYDAARRTHVVKREDLGKFLFENTDVNYSLKNPEDPRIKDAKDLQSRLDALYRADTTQVTISAERIAPWIQQVRVAIPRGTHKPLDLREIGDVYKEGQEIPYFVTPQEALAQLADFALTKEELIVVKAHDWIAVPTKRETTLPGGEKVVRTVFDTWRGVPDDGQYVALTERASISQFLSLGETVLSVRARKPKVVDTIIGDIPAPGRDGQDGRNRVYSGDTGTIGEIYSIEDRMSGGEIFVDGFLVQGTSNTLFTYNVSSPDFGVKPFHYTNGDYPATTIVSRVIEKTRNKEIIKKILQEAYAAGVVKGKDKEHLTLELTPVHGKYTLDHAAKKLWREAFTEVYGKEAVVATDSSVEQGNWLQYYCDANRSYHALAQRFGHKPIKLVSGIEKTLLDAGVISDRSAFERGVDYALKTDLSGKTKIAYDLAVAVTQRIQEHVNSSAERKHAYEVHFFTAATLTATGATAKDLTYAKKLEAQTGSENITHHVYINVKEAEKITDEKSAKQYVSEVMKLALDEGTAREFAIHTITRDLDGAIKVAGGYKTTWERLLGSFGGGKK